MDLREYFCSTGIKINFFAKKHNISEASIFRILKGKLVGRRIAEQIKAATEGKVMPPHTIKRRASRSKNKQVKNMDCNSKQV